MFVHDSLRAALLLAVAIALTAGDRMSQAESPKAPTETNGAPKNFKPIGPLTKNGLAYLAQQQFANGGWGQGGGWRQNNQGNGRVEGTEVSDPADLGNTCIATLALVRAGNTTVEGPHAASVERAVRFICGQVEKANDNTLYVTDVRDTQLQSKIGQYVDTFLAGLVLSELKGKLPPGELNQRVLGALDKTVSKIEKNQKEDGTFNGNTGWASVLSQGLASKFLNRAAQNQVAVKDEVLERDYKQTVAGLDKKTGEFLAAAAKPSATSGPRSGVGSAAAPALAATSEPSDAGVKLYYSATNAGRVSDFGNTSVVQEEKAKEVLRSEKATPQEKSVAEADLKRIADVRGAQKAVIGGIVRQLDDKSFVAGFGNNGGEEFLSYMNISEMLAAQGGNEWLKWDKSITENLERVQNKDGSWSGQHCITGRTFCTAAALLTLMADRAPVPTMPQIKK